jgi:hypothetical protein
VFLEQKKSDFFLYEKGEERVDPSTPKHTAVALQKELGHCRPKVPASSSNEVRLL